MAWQGILDSVVEKVSVVRRGRGRVRGGAAGRRAQDVVGLAAAAAAPRARVPGGVPEYHLLRGWVEDLEARQLLAATFGGFSFTADPADGAAETALQNVFNGGPVSASLTGKVGAAGQEFSGTFTVTRTSPGVFSVSASNVNVNINGLVTVSNASASFGLSGTSFGGSISAGTLGIAAGLSMTSPSLSLSWNTAGDTDIKVGAGGTFNIGGGQAITGGTFTFERNGGNVSASLAGGTLSLGGGMLTVAGLNASMDLTVSGIKVSASAGVAASFSAGGASFSGNVALGLDTTFPDAKDDYVRLTADNMQIAVGGITFQGDIGFQQVRKPDGALESSLIGVSVADVNISFKDNNGTTVVSLTSPDDDAQAGTFLIQSGKFAGAVKGTVTVNAAGGVSASGTTVLVVNTDTDTASFPDPLDMAETLQIPAGPLVQLYARDLNLNVSGSQVIQGDFGFESKVVGGARVVTIEASDVDGTFGAVSLNDAGGNLKIGVASGGTAISGSVKGGITFSGGGVTSSGGFTASFGASGTQISGEGVSVVVAGQTFEGSFAVDAQPTETTFTITDAALHFGSGLLTVDDLTGSFKVNSGGTASGTVSGTLAASIGQAAFSGGVAVGFGGGSLTLSGSDVSLTIGDESVSGSFTITDNGAGTLSMSATGVEASLGGGLVVVSGASLSVTAGSGSVAGTFTGNVSAGTGLTAVSFGGQVTVSIAPDAVSASGTNNSFTVNGQVFEADFTFSKDSQGLALGISGVDIDLGGGAITVTNASGTLIIPADKSGITGTLSAGFSSNLANFSGDLEISFSPGAFALAATDVELEFNGQKLSGDMGITVSGSDLEFTAENLNAELGGGLVRVVPAPAGTSVPPTTLKIQGGVFSGSFGGIVQVGSATGVGFSGLVTVTVDQNEITATGTDCVLSIAGQDITANFTFSKVGADLKVAVSGVNFSVGSLLSVTNASGNLTVTPTGVTGGATGTVSSGIGNLQGTLTVGFAPGVIKLSGVGNKLVFGDQYVEGDFDFIKEPAGLKLAITNFKADLGGGLVRVTGGSATLNVDQASGAVSGSLAGTVDAGPTITAAGVDFGGSIAVTVGGGVITAKGTNNTLTIGSASFSTSFEFYKSATDLQVKVTGLNLNLGNVIQVQGASGTLTINAQGVRGSTSGTVTSTLAGLSGTFGVGFEPGKLMVSGTNASLNVSGNTLVGDFQFTLVNGSDLDLDIKNLTVNLGGGLVRVGGQNGVGASAHLSVSGGAISGNFSGYLGVGTGSGFSFGGQVDVAVDSATNSVTASGTGVTLTIGGQTLTGNFGFAKNGSNLEVSISDVAFSVGSLISVTNVNGTVVAGATGLSGNVSGTIGQSMAGLTADSFGISFAPGVLQIAATNAALNIGGQTLSGNFNFRQDNTGLRLTSSNITAKLGGGLVKVEGGSASLAISNGNVTGGFAGTISVDSAMTGGAVGFSGSVTVNVAPGSITASGTNNTLTVAGYQLTSDFSFAKVGADLKLTISNLNFSLGGALSITNAGGTLNVTSGGVSGSAYGTVSSNLSGISIGGTLGVAFAPGTLSVSGVNNYIEAAGQRVSGDFTFTQDASGLSLTASNFTASLGGGLVTVDNGSGSLAVANGAITGAFAGTLHAGTVGGGVSFDGPIEVSVTPGGITAATPAGQTSTLTIGSQQISAGFSFVKTAAGLELTVTDLTASLGPVSLTDGGGTLVVSSTGVSGTAYGTLATSFTGFSFTGSLAASFAPGSFKLSGTNNKLTVGDQSISGDFSFSKDNTGVKLSASNISASLGGGIVSITNGFGTLEVATGGGISGSFGAQVSAGAGTSGFAFSGGIEVTVAPGSITARTPAGQTNTLTVLGNTMSAGFFFQKDAQGLKLTVSDVNLSFAGGTVAVNNAGGTLLVTKTGISGSIQGGLSASVPGVTFNSTNFDISFAPGQIAIAGTGVSLTAYGQTIGGNFSFASNPNSVTLSISNLTLSLGGVVNVTQGAGEFVMTKGVGGGMSGSASGNVQIAGVGPDVQFGGTFSVAVGNNTVAVSGTGTTLTLFGQKLSGNFSFTKTPTAVNFSVNALNLNLGGGLVLVTGGAANFTIANGGVTGSASGTISVGGGLSGVGFGGTVEVIVTTTGLSVRGQNTQITIAGQTVSAEEITFARNNATGALAASITNLGLAIEGNTLPVSLNGSLIVAPTGMAGTLTGTANLGGVNGTVSVNFGNGQFTVSAGVNASFNESIGPVQISGTIAAQGSTGGGGSASIELTDLMINMGNGLLTVTGGSASFDYAGGKISGSAGGTLALNGVPGVTLGGTVQFTITKVGATSTISVTGTDMVLSVLGQTVRGNFSFTDNGNGTITLAASNMSVSLADAISLTGGAANFTLGRGVGANAGIKGTGSGNLSVSLPGVGFSAAFGLEIDNTGGKSLFRVAANPMTITVGGVGLTGSFAVQKVTTNTGKTTVSIVASNIDTFIGDGTTGVHISNAGGSILILPTGTAVDVYGAAQLVGVSGLELAGTLHARMNNTGGAVNQVVPAPDPANPGQTINQTLKFAGNEAMVVSGTATLSIGDGGGNTFVALSGGFSVSSSKTTVGSVTTTKLLIGAAGINAFLGTGDPNGSDAMGVKISDANLGLAVIATKNTVGNTSSSVYALSAGGSAALLGVPALTLSGSLAVRTNTAGAVNETIQVPDPANPGSTIPVELKFAGNMLPAFAGSVSVAIADPNDPTKQFLSLGGSFAFSREVSGATTRVKASVTGASAFVGVGGANPIGLQLKDGSLGLVMVKTGAAASTYALAAEGNVAIVGLPGLHVGGTIGIRTNNTGVPQTNPADGSTIASGVLIVSVDDMTVAIKDADDNDIVSIVIDATITKSGAVTNINATSATLALNAGSQPLVSVTGAVQFTLGANGFNLGPAGFQILSFSILGDTMTAVPAPAPLPLAAGGSASGVVAQAPTTTSTGTGSSNASTGTGGSITLPAGTPRKLGPLSLYNLKPAFNGFGFSGGQLSVNVGLKADAAALALGGAAGGATNQPNAGGVTALMSGFQGTLGMAVGLDLASFRVTNFGPTGAFDFHANNFVLDVPKVLNVTASNIDIKYDPKATDPQKILSIGTATLTVPIGPTGNGIQGQIAPALDENGKTLPGLEIWSDHIQLGRGTLTYVGTVGISSLVTITSPFVSVTDLYASFDGALDFSGSITIGAGAVKIGPPAFQFSGTSVAATLTQSGGDWGFEFKAGTLGVSVASTVSLSATNVTFNPGATGSETLISVSSLNASLSLSRLTLTGTAGAGPGDTMKILGDGSLSLPNNFSIGVNFSAGSSGELGWPSWIPIQIRSLLLTWPNFNTDKTDFTITFSAHVGGTYGPVTLEGDLNNVTIDVKKLIAGQFPITGIDSGMITAAGPAFGGEISGTLVLGVIKLDEQGHQVPPGPGVPFDSTIFYAGIKAELTTPSFGAGIRFGISEKGPLEAYIQASADIVVVPPIGLAIKTLYGGVSFNAQPFPNIARATDLKNPVFSPGMEITEEQWMKQLRQSVVNQAGGGGGGYLFSVSSGANAIVAGLDSNTITAALSNEFLSYGYVLSSSTASGGSLGLKPPQVVQLQPGMEWMVYDSSKYYLLSKDLTGAVQVSQYKFVIDASGTGAKGVVGATPDEIVTQLNAGTITSAIVDAFGAYGIYLSSSAAVTADAPKTPGQPVTSWTVRDGEYTFKIARDAYNKVLTVSASGGSMSGMHGAIRIEAAVTLGFVGAPPMAFSGTGSVIIDTSGKILLDVAATFGGAAKFNFKTFVDLSDVANGNVTTLFYFEQNVTIPVIGTFPRLVVAAGADFGLIDADGVIISTENGNTGSPVAGFGILLSGRIEYYQVPTVGIMLDGAAMLTFTATEATLKFNASLSATITPFIQASNIVTAAGTFTMAYGDDFELYGAASVQFDSGAIPFLENVGIQANAQIFLRINTADEVRDVEFDIPAPGGPPGAMTHLEFDLQPGSFGLYLVGQMVFAKGPIKFEMGGVFSVDFVYNAATKDFKFDVFVFAQLDLGVAGQTLLTTHALGLLEISNDGFAAMLAIEAEAGTDLGTGVQLFSFDFDFTLFTNTTGRVVEYTLPNDLSAIIGQQDGAIAAAGGTGLLTSLTNVLNRLDDKYGAGNGSLVEIDPDSGDITIKVPAGMPRIDLLGDYQGSAAPGPYFVVQGAGNVEVLETFTLSGSFVIQASVEGVALGAQAKMELGPIADISASGFINIGPNGVYAALTLASSISLGGIASLFGAAVLEINTTGQDQKVKQYTFNQSTGQISNTPVDVIIPGAQKFKLDVEGRLRLANLFDMHGHFFVTLTSAGPTTELTLGISASVKAFFGLDVSVGGSAVIREENGSIGFAVMAKANLYIDLAGIVVVDVDAYFDINTLGVPEDVPNPDTNFATDVTINPGFKIRLDGSLEILSILEFDMSGEVSYNAITKVFTLSFLVDTHIDLFIFDATLKVGGWLDSTGQFGIGIYGEVGFDAGIAALEGAAWLYVAYTSTGSPNLDGNNLPQKPGDGVDRSGTRTLYIGGGGYLALEVFGIDIATALITFQVNSNLDIYFSAKVRLNFLLFSVTVGFTVNVGSFGGERPNQLYLAGTPTQGQVAPGSFSGGPLVLNVGNRAGNRNDGNATTAETITVQGSNYNASTKTQTIYVTINGNTQTYKNVSSLQIPATGAATINVLDSVQVPVNARVGSGGRIFNASKAAATLQGSSGNDLIQSGSGATTIIGGGGADTILIGSGAATVTTTGGASRVLWNTDTSGNVTWTGAAGDKLFATANTPETAFANGEVLSLTKVAAGSARLSHVGYNAITFSNVSSVLLSAPGGGNTITVGDLVGAGISTLDISYGQSHGVGNTLSVAGSIGADTYTLSSGTGPLPVMPTIENLNPGASGISVATNSISRTGGLTINVFGTSATAGDSVTVNSKGGNDNFYLKSVSVPTTLMGNDVTAAATTPYTTYYYVGWQGAGKKGTLSSVTALLAIKGGNGKDVLVMDDTSDFYNRTFSLTDTQLVSDALGVNGRLTYDAKMDNFNLFAGPGHNTYFISGTSAAGATQINGGDTDLIINAPLAAPLAVNGGDALGMPNTLTVNGTFGADAFTIGAGFVLGAGAPLYFTNFHILTVNGNGGNDSYTVSGNTVPVVINATAGNDTVVIEGASAPVTVNTGAGTDAVTVNGSAGPLTVTALANATFTVNGNAAATTLVGGTGINTFNVYANNGTLTLTGGSGINAFNTFNLYGNGKTLTANSNGGASAFTVSNIASAVNLVSGNAAASFTIAGPLYAPVNITGGTTVQTMTVSGTAWADDFRLTTTSLTGAGAPINYTGLMAVTINGLGGDDTFTVASTNAPTVLNAGLGNSTFNVETISASLTINTGTGISASAINLATRLSQLQGAVTITGTGNDTLNVSDAASAAGGTGALTDTTLTGWGMNATGVTFSGIKVMNLTFGAGVDTLAVASISNATTTVNVDTAGGADVVNLQAVSHPLNLTTGTGANVVNAGEALPAPATGSTAVKLQGPIVVGGGGGTTLNVSNTGDTSPQLLTITSTTLTGLAMGAAGITYAGLANLNVALGSGGNLVTLASTAAATVTHVTGGTGNDTFDVLSTAGPTAITTGTGTNTVNVNAATLDAIQGALTVTGSGTDTLNVFDTNDNTDESGTLTSSTITGFGLGAGGITYNTVDVLNLTLGSGDLTVTVMSTAAGTATTLTTGAGNDTITVEGTGLSPTTILAGDGDDVVHVRGTGGVTNVGVGTGTNAVNLGSAGHTLDAIQGTVNVTGTGVDAINFDDTAAVDAKVVTVSDTAVNVTGMATVNYVGDTGLASLSINLGSGLSSLTILSTRAGATTSVTTGSADDVVTVQNTGGTTLIDTGNGNDTITVRGTSAATTLTLGGGDDTVNVGSVAGTLDGIQGGLTVVGSDADVDTLNVNDGGSAVARTGTLTAAALTGFGMTPAGIAYSGIRTVGLTLGTLSTDLTINGTAPLATTSITGTAGSDKLTFNAIGGTTQVTSSTGASTFNVRGAAGPLTITSAVGATNAINITADGAVGAIGNFQLVGNGSDVLTIDDSAGAVGRTVTVSPTHVTFAGPGAQIGYAGVASLAIKLGTAVDTMTVSGTSAPTTIDTGDGNDSVTVQDVNVATTLSTGGGTNTVSILATHAALVVNTTAGGVNQVFVGAGSTADIAGAVTVNGGGTDSLTLQNQANASAATVTVTPTTVAGLSPATITYAGLASLTLNLGTASDAVTVSGTAATTTTGVNLNAGGGSVTVDSSAGPLNVHTGAQGAIVVVKAASAPVSVATPAGGSSLVQLGDNGSVDGITAPVMVTGPGTLQLMDGSNTTAKSVAVTATRITGLTGAAVNYSGLTNLVLHLGNGDEVLTVASTAAGTATTINAGGGSDSVTVTSTASPLTINTGTGANMVSLSNLQAFNGAVNVVGSGADLLLLDETGRTSNAAGTFSATQVTGLSPATISYSGISTLTLTLGGGTNTVAVQSSSAKTVIASGAGADNVTVGSAAPSTGGQMSGVGGELAVLANGNDTLTLDDSGASTNKTVTVTAKRVTGLSAVPVNFANLSALAILLGGGSDTVTVEDTSSGHTTLHTGGGNDAVDLLATTNPISVSTGGGTNTVSITTPADIDGAVSVDGSGGSATLNLSNAGGTVGQSVTITNNSVTGVTPATVSYAGLVTLNVTLGSGNDQVVVSSTAANATTNVNTGAGSDAVTVTVAGVNSIAGALNLDASAGTDTLAVDASADSTPRSITLTPTTLGGFGATISYADFASLSAALGAGANALSVDGAGPTMPVSVTSAGPLAASLHFTGDFAGNFSLPATSTTTLVVDGSLSGTFATGGTVTSATIGQNLAGMLTAGSIKMLTILGNDTGIIAAGSIDTVYLPNAAPSADGVVFSATQGGTLRSIKALTATSSDLSGVRFAVAYDGTGTNPSAAIRVTSPNAVYNRFDLLLETTRAGAPFDLARVEMAPGKAAGVRNVVVSGSLLPNMSQLQMALLGKPSTKLTGGVFLPNDRLAAVSVRNNIHANSVRAASIQALSFHTHTDATGKKRTANQVAADDKRWADILKSTLVIDPKTKKPYAKVAKPTETLRLVASDHPQGLFIGKMTPAKGTKTSLFDRHVTYISDSINTDTPVMADVTFAAKPKAGRPVIDQLAFTGAGGSVRTDCFVNRISSTGPLGDVTIDAGPQQILRQIDAPEIRGKVKLFGGKLITESGKAIRK